MVFEVDYILTHWGLMKPYSTIELCPNWFRLPNGTLYHTGLEAHNRHMMEPFFFFFLTKILLPSLSQTMTRLPTFWSWQHKDDAEFFKRITQSPKWSHPQFCARSTRSVSYTLASFVTSTTSLKEIEFWSWFPWRQGGHSTKGRPVIWATEALMWTWVVSLKVAQCIIIMKFHF